MKKTRLEQALEGYDAWDDTHLSKETILKLARQDTEEALSKPVVGRYVIKGSCEDFAVFLEDILFAGFCQGEREITLEDFLRLAECAKQYIINRIEFVTTRG